MDVSPPSVDLIDEDVHHRVFGPLFNVITLKQKSVRSKAQFGESVPQLIRVETDRLIETQTRLELLCREERTKCANFGNQMGDGVRWQLPYSNSNIYENSNGSRAW